jgi:hypothetical protein
MAFMFLHVRRNTNKMVVARLVYAVLQTVSFFYAFLIVFIKLLHNRIHIFITPSSYTDLNMKVQLLTIIMITNCSVLEASCCSCFSAMRNWYEHKYFHTYLNCDVFRPVPYACFTRTFFTRITMQPCLT